MPMAPERADASPVAAQAAPARSGAIGTKRLRQAVTAIAGGGLTLVLVICGAELALRDELKPTVMMATIEAGVERGIFNQKMGAKPGVITLTEADYQKAIAKAQREGQAQADLAFQKELAVVQADKERVVGAYQTLYQRANIIAQAAVQMEVIAQQFRQELIRMTNGGRAATISVKDIFCGFGMEEACASAREDRRVMMNDAETYTSGDVARKVRELMAGVEDPATFITREDRKRHGAPRLERR